MEKHELLLKSSWNAQDIAEYYGISVTTAVNVKVDVEVLFGTPSYYSTKERVNVRADDVIKFMGGNSRMEEMQLLEIATKIKNAKEE